MIGPIANNQNIDLWIMQLHCIHHTLLYLPPQLLQESGHVALNAELPAHSPRIAEHMHSSFESVHVSVDEMYRDLRLR